MVDQLWESMSNVKGEDIEEMAKSVNPGLTIGSQNFHKGDRRKVSIKELQAQEPQRKQRLEAADRKAKANAKQAEHKGEVKKA